MVWLLRVFVPSKRFLTSIFLCFYLLLTREPVWAINELAFTFANADIQTVIKKVGEFTGTTFLFDPKEVKGKITILSPQKVAPEGVRIVPYVPTNSLIISGDPEAVEHVIGVLRGTKKEAAGQ